MGSNMLSIKQVSRYFGSGESRVEAVKGANFEIQAGEISVIKGGSNEQLAVSKGFAEVIADKVSILAEHAIKAADIDPDEIEQRVWPHGEAEVLHRAVD